MGEIENKIVRLEERVDGMNTRISEIDKSLAVFSSLVERSLLIQEKLSGSIDRLSTASNEMQLAMSQMQGEIRNVVAKMGDLENKFSEAEKARKDETQSLRSAITEVETKTKKKIEEVDDKGKIDWILLVRQALISAILGGGLWAIILYVLERLK